MTSPDDLRREASRWHGRNEPLRLLLLQAAERLEAANLEKSEGRESRDEDARPDRDAIRADRSRWPPV